MVAAVIGNHPRNTHVFPCQESPGRPGNYTNVIVVVRRSGLFILQIGENPLQGVRDFFRLIQGRLTRL